MKFLIALLLITNIAQAAHFNTGSDVPTEELKQELLKVYREKIQGLPLDTLIQIEGHTDSRGSDKVNQDLSRRRAEAAAKFYSSLGATNVRAIGRGETQLVDTGNSLESHANNRRVVIIVNNSATVISESKKKEEPAKKQECESKTVVLEKIKPHKHILSLEMLRSHDELSRSTNGNSTSVRIEKDIGVGVMYQNNIYKNLYLGGKIDTNGGVGINLGLGL